MKLPHVDKAPPSKGWVPLRIEYPLRITTANGEPERILVEIDAWKDLDDQIVIEGEVSEKLEELKARLMGLMSPAEIKALRVKLQRTQKQLSELLQIGEKTWSRWESGRERPSRSMNVLLCALRDERIDLDYLTGLKARSTVT